MVPAKLKLSSFTSYGENVPELDFTNFHMAAISGLNGAGKSSLLDSITWCVWGSSRLGESSDQLIRLGQGTMFVEFSFELDDHIYTVKRQRILKGGGSTTLEFLSNAHNLTEGTIKATQQKIIDTLHLTYETFVNSAFIRQGHADEFTTKGPTDRKRILADILGLSHYEVLEEKAKEKAKEVQTKLQLLEYQLLEIEAELSQKEEREKKLSAVQEDEQKAKKELVELEKEIKVINLEKEAASAKLHSLQEAKNRVEQALKELSQLKIKIAEAEESQEKYKQIISQKEEIKKGYANLQKLREEEKALNVKRSELIKVKDELVVIQKVIKERDDKRKAEISRLEIQKQQLETINQEAQQKIDHLKSHQASCPTCGQSIGKEKNAEILSFNKKIIAENSGQIKEIEVTIKKYASAVFSQQTEAEEKESRIAKLEEQTKNYREVFAAVSEYSQYEHLQAKLQEAETALNTQQTTITELKSVLQTRQREVDKESQNLADLDKYESQLEEIHSRLAAREEVKAQVSQKLFELSGQVGEARQLVSRAKQLEDLQEKRKAEKSQLSSEKGAYEELALAFGKKGIQAMIIESAIPEIEDEANRLLDKLTEGRMRVHFETQRETKTKVAGEYGTIETLDIIISDEMGERPYEAYSGGEQFRVNFAMRLALSKLLTHRAGARLQFLVVDEGFGTQDAQGRTRIVEALDAIKDDFEKILIITHLEELKEEFPVRIEVSKGPTGSTFEVVGV